MDPRGQEDSEEVLRKYLKAGDIAYRVKKELPSIVKPGTKLLDIASIVERRIRELGGEPAFPVNISINYIAAHRTPYADDGEAIPEESVVKVDIGVHVDGYIADTAVTLVFDDYYIPLAEASRNALLKGLKRVGAGVKFRDVGKTIETVIKRSGFKVIKNLTGHSLGRYVIHSGESVPNFNDPISLGRFRQNRAYAIEPFATDGKGLVRDLRSSIQIYSLRKVKGKALNDAEDRVLETVVSRFRTLPFCERWLVDMGMGLKDLRAVLQSLSRKGYLNEYPVLVEIIEGYVAQFEETVFITKDRVYVTTNPELSS